MLTRLQIENLTVFQDVKTEFSHGLNVITGETGAGKTMLLEGLKLVSGAKADSSLIGPSSDEAYVEASFEAFVPEALKDLTQEGEELILARRLRQEGAARALCNGRGCSAGALEEAAVELISLTGQHAARRLTSPAYQLELLDQAGEISTREVQQDWKNWREAQTDLDDLRKSLLDRNQRLQFLKREQELYEEVSPEEREEETLQVEREQLRHAESLAQSAHSLHEVLSSQEESVIEKIDLLEESARSSQEHDTRFSSLADTLLDCRERLADVSHEAASLASGYEANPTRLQEVEERLYAISELRRHFNGLSLIDIKERINRASEELSQLEEGDTALERLEKEEMRTGNTYQKSAEAVREKRKKAAKKLRKEVESHLEDLALPDAKLEVRFEEAKPSSRGVDRIVFLLQANPGLQAAELGKGASGGELSRVNLALLLASSKQDKISYVFDEVDAGIGGKTAHSLAKKLKELSETSQVIVITHLAQIAVQADTHVVVEKKQSEKRTQTVMRELVSKEERDAELARLVGADKEAGADIAQIVKSGAR